MIKRSSRVAAVVALLVLGLLGGTVVTPGVLASHSANRGVIGGFGIDGDFVTPSTPALAGETRDWANVSGAIVDPDPANNAADDIFGGGSKESEPDGWTYTTGKPPGKDDLVKAYFAKDTSNDQALLWLGFERLAVSGQGDAHANFELNRKTTTVVNSKGTVIPERTTGDLLVIYDYAGGSGPVNLEVRTWLGAANVATTLQNEEALFGSWERATIPASAAFADINGAPVARPGGDFGTGNVAAKRFGEVGLDLNAIYGNNFLTCPGFSQMTVKTRSSGESFNSALKDKDGPFTIDFSRCLNGTKNWSFTFSPQPIAGATVSAVYTVAGGATRTAALTDPDANGTFTATDGSIPAGSMTYHFEVKNAGGQLIWRSDHDPVLAGDQDGTENFAAGQTRNNSGSLAYRVVMPGDAVNFADSPHLFTARVSEVSTDKSLPNVAVNFATFSGSPSGCGSFTPTSGVTDAGGQVSTTLSSATACTTSLRAFVNGTTTGSTSSFNNGEATDDSEKSFVAYALTVTPATAVNKANDPHTFTTTLTRNSGSGAVAVSGATVHLSLNAGGTDAHFTSINGLPASGTEADCTTNASGQCSATIVSSQPGSTTLTATYAATASEGTRTITSNPGDKKYVDASISIADASAVNAVGDPHTFTVTVTASPGGTGTPDFDSITTTVTPPLPPADHTSTCNTPQINGNTATCTVTINSASAGVFTVDATADVIMGGVTVTRSTSGESGTAGSGGAVKRFVDASIAIDPLAATNEIGDAHTFNITVTALPSGAGAPSYVITPSVTPSPSSESTTCGTPTVEGNTATCTITINSTSAGAFTVNATAVVTMGGVPVTRSTSGTSGPDGTGPAVKTFVSVTLNKTACPITSAPRGGPVVYTLAFSVTGGPLTDAVLVDTLPAGITFDSADEIAGVSPVPTNNDKTITWTFPTLAPGSYTGTILATVADTAPLGGSQVNTVTLNAVGISEKSSSHTLTVSTLAKEASGRAFGLSLNLLSDGLTLGDPEIAPTPDSDVVNPDELLSLPDPFGSTTPLVSLLRVAETDSSTATQSSYSAIATAAAVRLDGLGITVSADSVVARSESSATATSATSSSEGSLVQNLVINGKRYGNVSEPTTIVVRNPLIPSQVLGEVHVLETIPTGAAGGTPSQFSSGLAVNGIHVVLNDLGLTPLINEASDLIVSHAETLATFPALSGCDSPGVATVSGVGYAMGVSNLEPDLGNVRVAEVVLPIFGGAEEATLADVELPADLGSSRTAFTSTTGQISGPIEAETLAQIEDLYLADGLVTATLVKATSRSTPGASDGDTTIADLQVAGFDVCDLLNLKGTCEPDPDTVIDAIPGLLIVLNEQLGVPGDQTVNAVHIYVLGAVPGSTLPVGAEIIVSSAHSDAHPAPSAT